MSLVIACGLFALAGAGAIAWVAIHFWVAMRLGASLARRDYVTLGLGLLGVAIGLGGLTTAAGHAARTTPGPASGSPTPNDSSSQPSGVPTTP